MPIFLFQVLDKILQFLMFMPHILCIYRSDLQGWEKTYCFFLIVTFTDATLL